MAVPVIGNCLVDLDQTWPKNSRKGNSISGGELSVARDDSSNCKTNIESTETINATLKGEASLKRCNAVGFHIVRNRNGDREILTGYINNARGAADSALLGINRELGSAVHGPEEFCVVDVETTEDFERYLVGVGA